MVEANKTFFSRLGRQPDEVIGRPVTPFFHPEGEDSPCPVCRARLAQQDTVVNLEADDARNHMGRSIRVRIGVVRDAQGNPSGIIQHIQDLTQIRAVEHKYHDTQKQFRELFEASPDPQIIVNSNGIIEQANAQCFEVLGYQNLELLGESVERLLPENLREQHAGLREMFLHAPRPRPMGTGELSCRCKDGTIIPVEVSLTPISVGEEVLVCAVIRDVRERKQADRELQRLASFPEFSPIPIIEVSREGHINYNNPSALNNFSGIETLGTDHPALSNLDVMINKVIESDKPVLRSVEIDGMVYEQQFYYARENDVVRIYSWDITEIRDMADEMEYFATHDALTGLINRNEFDRRINHLLDQSVRESREHALCYIDLDQFKIINDKCGHSAGDEMLRQLGYLLRDHVRETDTLARLGGDEFGLLLPACGIDKALEIAEKIRKAISGYRFAWESYIFTVGASIGLVPISRNSGSVKDIMRAADTACFVAKDTGRDRVHVYRPDDYELGRHIKNIEWAQRLQQALSKDQFCLHKQVIRPLDANERDRYELLVRMVDEEGKLNSPGAFIPAAERFNLIKNVDKWVVDAAFRLVNKGYLNPGEISINLSGDSLGDTDMINYVIDKLEEYCIEPKGLTFEITETAMITNLTNAQKFMAVLHKVGCRFALDDFGSGVSSFSYLQNLHVDYLKIDGDLIRNSVTNKINESMVKAINDIGHAMGIETVAEFVEDEAIYRKMQEIGVDYVQGYYLGLPCPVGGN